MHGPMTIKNDNISTPEILCKQQCHCLYVYVDGSACVCERRREHAAGGAVG